MSLGRMSKGIDFAVLILITRTTVIHGDGSGLNHGIGKCGTRIGLGTPCPFGLCMGISQVGRLPQGGCTQERIDITGKTHVAGWIGRLGLQTCTKEGKQGHERHSFEHIHIRLFELFGYGEFGQAVRKT